MKTFEITLSQTYRRVYLDEERATLIVRAESLEQAQVLAKRVMAVELVDCERLVTWDECGGDCVTGDFDAINVISVEETEFPAEPDYTTEELEEILAEYDEEDE